MAEDMGIDFLNEMSPDEALFDAVRRNDLDIAANLLRLGLVDVNQLNNVHKTALYLAMENECAPMVTLLVNHGADVNLQSYCQQHCSFEAPVVTAARLEKAEFVELFLDHGGKGESIGGCAGVSSRNAKTALQWAATYGDITMAELLLRNGSDINQVGPYLHSALHYATLADNTKMVDWLLENGAVITVNGDARSPLHIAAVRGDLRIIELLFKCQLEVNAKDNFGFTPFSLASLRGHAKVIQYMMRNSPAGVRFDLNDGLHKASDGGHVEVMMYMLDNGANVNSVNRIGESALSIAARGQVSAIQVLLERGAKINHVDHRGYTPLQLSLLRERKDNAICLIRHGAHLHALSPNTESPLRITYTISAPLLIKFLIGAGCDLKREEWFTKKLVEDKIEELDYQHGAAINRYRDDMGSYQQCKDSWNMVTIRMHVPRSLTEISRITIRSHISSVVGGQSIIDAIKSLPLPTRLKEYLALSDVFPLTEELLV